MEVRNCKGCNRLFQYIGGPTLCPTCREELEKKFVEVKEYIYANPGASITQVSEAQEVSVKQIKQWIREDRLVLSTASPDGVLCEQCGVPICSGRFCATCKSRIANELGSVVSKPRSPISSADKKDKDGNKMRFLK